jgi:hypothetical protein
MLADVFFDQINGIHIFFKAFREKKRVKRASMLKSARLVVDSGLVLAVCLPTIEPPHTASAEFRQRSLPIQRKLRPLS